MTKLKIALEWFLNPDHLPMIVGIELGRYKEAGIDLEIIQPDDHYDGFADLKSGQIDIHCNEPLHLFEHHFDGLKSMGCFFETRGGVMMRQSSVKKLESNQPIRITTPASNEVTNKIGFEILRRYALKNGFILNSENVTFVQTDFWHLNNLENDESFDGAWLCFYNFEGIEAKMKNFPHLFIDQYESPYPNFSALEFMTTQNSINEKGEALCSFIKVTNEMASFCQENEEEARDIYYSYKQEIRSDLMDAIIKNTIPLLVTDTKTDNYKWLKLYNFLKELGLVSLSDEQYEKIWENKPHLSTR